MGLKPLHVIRDTIKNMIRCFAFTAGFRKVYFFGVTIGAFHTLTYTAGTAILLQVLLDRVQVRDVAEVQKTAIIVLLILVTIAVSFGFVLSYTLGYMATYQFHNAVGIPFPHAPVTEGRF